MAVNLTSLTMTIVDELKAYVAEQGGDRPPGYEANLTRAIVDLVKHEHAFQSGASGKVNPHFEKVCADTGQALLAQGWTP